MEDHQKPNQVDQKRQSQEDRRKLKRRYLMFYSRVYDRKNGKMLGYLADMTIEGAMVISEEPIPTDEVYRLRIDLPEDIYGKAYMNLEAHSVWSKPDVNPNFYMTGFQLLNVSSEDREIIQRIIQDYGFRD